MKWFNDLSLQMKLLLGGALAIAILLVILVLTWSHATTTAAEHRLGAAQDGATIQSSKDAISTIGNVSAAQAAGEDLTRSNGKEIDAAPGSNVTVAPEAQAAGIAALCRRAAYRDNPRCKGAPK